ncbi:MAG TPA: zinc ribbon domain-containing protein [Candidatus Angelobacter sp.]|nr:zinc ribbon domain-containing protein [Candidatus Angelobacter sp.]
MAEFCTNCGAPLSGPFCGRCGHRAQSATAPAPVAAPTPQPVAAPTAQPVATTQPTAQPQPASTQAAQQSLSQQSVTQQPAQPAPQASAAQPPKSSGGGKALLIVGGIILVMVLGAFGAVLYGVHWVKHKVSSITGGAIGGGSSEVSQGNMCKLLSTGDLQQMIGVTVERSAEIMDNGDPGCAYYTNPAAFAELQKLAIAQAKRDSEKASQEPDVKNSKGDNPLELLKHTKEMEGIVKGFGLSAPDPSGRVFSFSVNSKFGSENWGPLRTTLSVVPGFDEVNGVGDHAMIGSFGHAFYVLKGDSVFKLDTMYLPEARNRGTDIANKIISHM